MSASLNQQFNYLIFIETLAHYFSFLTNISQSNFTLKAYFTEISAHFLKVFMEIVVLHIFLKYNIIIVKFLFQLMIFHKQKKKYL